MIHQVRELHVRRDARARYDVDEGLFALSGNAILPNLRAVRELAAGMTAGTTGLQPVKVCPSRVTSGAVIAVPYSVAAGPEPPVPPFAS